MVIKIVKDNIIFSRFCNGKIDIKRPSKDIEKLEKVLFLMHVWSLEKKGKPLLTSHIYVNENKIRIPYLSDLMRVCPDFQIYYSSLELLVSEEYTIIYKELMRKEITSLDKSIEQSIKSTRQPLNLKKEKYNSVLYRKIARLYCRKNQHPFLSGIKTILISLPATLIPVIIIVMFWLAFVEGNNSISLLKILYLVIVEIIFIIIWILITLKQTSITEYEKKRCNPESLNE